MTWISIKDNKRIPACTAVGSVGTTQYNENTFTQVAVDRWMGNSDPELFQFLNGGIKVTEAGLYLVSGSVFVGTSVTSNQSVSVSVRYANGDVEFGEAGNTLIASKYQSNWPVGAINISAKPVNLEPCTLFLAVRNEAGASNYVSAYTAANTGTSLTIVKLNSKRGTSI